MQLTEQFKVGDELLDPAFLYDFMAVSVEHLYDRYKAVLAAQEYQPMPPGQFANTLLALGFHAVCFHYGTEHKPITFENVFPDSAFEKPIADLHLKYQLVVCEPYCPGMDLLSFKNWLMVNGISEMCKQIIEAEKKLGISQ